MSIASLIRLLTLSAIWGGSFLFMRVTATVLSPAVLIEFRVGLAALFLFIVALYLKKPLSIKQHWRHYLILGLFNSALPFLLIAYSAQTISASLLSVLNATTPIWGCLIGVIWKRNQLSFKSLSGLLAGLSGVMILVGFDPVILHEDASNAIIAALLAAFLYSVASTYAQTAKSVEAFNNAHGSMWGASLVVLPLLIFTPATTIPSPDIMLMVVLLGVFCTGIAYMLYFRLIADIGAPSALTVTFLVPVFGVLFGVIFLDELFGWHTIIGAGLVLIGTTLVTGFDPRIIISGSVAERA